MYYSRYASRDVKQKFQFVPAKDVPPEYNPVDRAFESSLRSDFNSSSELFCLSVNYFMPSIYSLLLNQWVQYLLFD